MEFRVKDNVVGGFYLLLQLTLLFPKVLLLGEHSAGAAASGTVHLRIAATGIGTSRPVRTANRYSAIDRAPLQ